MRGSCEPFSRGPKRATGESARNREGTTRQDYAFPFIMVPKIRHIDNRIRRTELDLSKKWLMTYTFDWP
jgi:hypothetical protein